MRISKEKRDELKVRQFARHNRDFIEATMKDPELLAKFRELARKWPKG